MDEKNTQVSEEETKNSEASQNEESNSDAADQNKSNESEEGSKDTDFEALLEKEKEHSEEEKTRRIKAEKVIEERKKSDKEGSSEKPEVNIDQMVSDRVSEELREFKTESNQSRAREIAKSMSTSGESETEYVYELWKNRFSYIPGTLDVQVKAAYAFANSDKLIQTAEEAKRALLAKGSKPSGSGQKQKSDNKAKPPVPSKEDQKVITVYNLRWEPSEVKWVNSKHPKYQDLEPTPTF